MKKLLILALLIPTISVAAGNSTSLTNNIPVTTNNTTDARNMSTSNSNGSDLSNSVGMAVAPGLNSTLSETCLGSTSIGVGFAGGAVSGGTTHVDEDCVRRLNAREIKSYGDVEVSKEIMCGNEEVRAAFKRVGRPCAVDGGVYTSSVKLTAVSINEISKQRQEQLNAAAALRISQENQKINITK